MGEWSVALIRVNGVGRYYVEMILPEIYRLCSYVKFSLALSDEVYACEGGGDVLPVPVAIVVGYAYVEHL